MSVLKSYKELSQQELAVELNAQQQRYKAYCGRGLKLNMARGKPAPEQLDLSLPMLDFLPSEHSAEALRFGAADDLRNYGGLTGLASMREVMGLLMGVPAGNVIIGGNSSLNMMYNMVSMAMTHGVLGSTPWAKLSETPAFLCPVPGYDRHFAVTEHFGIRMIPVELGADGPNMDEVERLVASDASIKGIWCVPRFSNPSGCVYSDETVERFARLKPAAEDFRIYWDNAYAVHAFAGSEGAAVAAGAAADAEEASSAGRSPDTGGRAPSTGTTCSKEEACELKNIKEACESVGSQNSWYQFASTSKITFAGSGIAAMATSAENLESITTALSFQTIGPDKINQERHAQFLPNLEAVHNHMARHAAIIKPKFDVVDRVLSEGLAAAGVGEWTSPQGGYFISFDGPAGTAKRTVQLAGEAGVVLTSAGATYPYADDPSDSNIRIAPTYPGLEELETAAEVFVVCARIAALEQLIK